MWVELDGKVKVRQSLLGVSENAVSYASVDEYKIISARGESTSVTGNGLSYHIIDKRIKIRFNSVLDFQMVN